MFMNYKCICDGDKVVDVDEVEIFNGVASSTAYHIGLYPNNVMELENYSVTRCYCKECGLMYHPESVGLKYGGL